MINNSDKPEIRSEADERCFKAGYRYDEAAANRVFRFFEKVLKHSKGKWAGKPFILQEWQRRDILGPLFGWKRPDGTRRYRRAFIEIPKKNGGEVPSEAPAPEPTKTEEAPAASEPAAEPAPNPEPSAPAPECPSDPVDAASTPRRKKKGSKKKKNS